MERKNAWKKYSDEDKNNVFTFADEYKTFISECKTERECVKKAVELAKKAGYRDLQEIIAANETLKAGDKVYAVNMKKAIVLFNIGSEPISTGMNILGAHIDSPRLDIKQNPMYEDSDLVLLDTHYYGGIKKYQWVAIPLALHGVVALKNGECVEVVIGEDVCDAVVGVSDLLIHLAAKQMEKKGSSVVEGEDLDNADFQYKAGLSPKIVRTSTGNCCEWCDKLAGTYEYSDVRKTGNNVWRRHSYCRCLVDYHPGNGKKQNAHTKIWENETELEKRKLIGLKETLKKIPQEIVKNAEHVEKSRENGILITDKQFGKKIGKHARDFGLDPSKQEDRKRMEEFILDIVDNHDDAAQGYWRGQTGLVDFFIKGNDVVILNKQRFVTILENGVQNERVKIARKRKV